MARIPAYRLAAFAGAVLLSGCGGGSAATEGAACPPVTGVGSGPRTGSDSAEAIAYLTGVQIAADGCADRLSFEFRSGRPGFRVEYLPASRALVEDGSGNEVAVDGTAFLVVRLEPAATAEVVDERLVVTYTGPRRLRPSGTRFVREVVKVSDFEAVVTWVIGLPEARPFRVSTENSGSRVVVEVD